MARLFTIDKRGNFEELEPQSYSTSNPLFKGKGESYLQLPIAEHPEELIPWEQILTEEDEEASVVLIKTEADGQKVQLMCFYWEVTAY